MDSIALRSWHTLMEHVYMYTECPFMAVKGYFLAFRCTYMATGRCLDAPIITLVGKSFYMAWIYFLLSIEQISVIVMDEVKP